MEVVTSDQAVYLPLALLDLAGQVVDFLDQVAGVVPSISRE